MKKAIIYGLLGFFFSIDYGKGANDTELTTQRIIDQARCVGGLTDSFDPMDPLDQMLFQVGDIFNKVQITSNNEEIVRKMQSLIRIHKSIKNKEERQSNVRIRTLLQTHLTQTL